MNKAEVIICACGCGNRFLRYDSEGNERKFIVGHDQYEVEENIYDMLFDEDGFVRSIE